VAAQATLSRQDAAHFADKLALVERTATHPHRAPVTTHISDDELNSYLRFLAGSQVPSGIVEPTISTLGGGKLGGSAVVDLDVVRTQKKRAWSDPLAYLSGRLPVTVSGTLTTENGTGHFNLTSAEISGVTIPKSLLQELLSYYSRTAQNPQGIDMDAPFALPSAIREIRVGMGGAVIVQ
jgi:hypothetical protein